jgi:hypothetical protein
MTMTDYRKIHPDEVVELIGIAKASDGQLISPGLARRSQSVVDSQMTAYCASQPQEALQFQQRQAINTSHSQSQPWGSWSRYAQHEVNVRAAAATAVPPTPPSSQPNTVQRNHKSRCLERFKLWLVPRLPLLDLLVFLPDKLTFIFLLTLSFPSSSDHVYSR